MAANAARQKVIDTNELLESFIVHSPAKNISGIQRVCKHFRVVIAASSGIQEKMFLRLKNQARETWVLESEWSPLPPKPNEREKPYFRNLTPSDKASNYNIKSPVVLNQNLHLVKLQTSYTFMDRISINGVEVVTLPWEPTVFRRHLSLFDTFITDPPLHRAKFHIVLRAQSDGHEYPTGNDGKDFDVVGMMHIIRIELETGLTLGKIFSEALKMRGARIRSTWTSSDPNLSDSEMTFTDAIDRFEERTGSVALMDLHQTRGRFDLILFDVAVPTAAKWAAVREDLAHQASAAQAPPG